MSNSAKEIFTGVADTARELARGIQTGIFETQSPIGSQGEYTEQLEASVTAYQERVEREKKADDEYYEGLRKGHPDSDPRHRDDAASHHQVAVLAKNFVDSMSIGNLKLAVLTNQIPTECMPDVLRFLKEQEGKG